MKRKLERSEAFLIQAKRRKEIESLIAEYARGDISLHGALLRAHCRGFVMGRSIENMHKERFKNE